MAYHSRRPRSAPAAGAFRVPGQGAEDAGGADVEPAVGLAVGLGEVVDGAAELGGALGDPDPDADGEPLGDALGEPLDELLGAAEGLVADGVCAGADGDEPGCGVVEPDPG